jgi:hypothetical protein
VSRGGSSEQNLDGGVPTTVELGFGLSASETTITSLDTDDTTFLRLSKRAAGGNLSLIAFLGRHSGPSHGPLTTDQRGEPLAAEAIRRMLSSALEANRAVVLLDGLDEIGDPQDRESIAREIDRFLDTRLPGGPGCHFAPLAGSPAEIGSNQVIITSRIVGYHLAPLKKDAAHLTIEPMGPRAISSFCDVWVRAVHRASMPVHLAWSKVSEKEAGEEAEGLKQAIAELEDHGAGELASNPLLITILALVFRNGRRSFPRHRVKLYESAVSVLIALWSRRAAGQGLDEEEKVRAILAPLAYEIHERSGIGIPFTTRSRHSRLCPVSCARLPSCTTLLPGAKRRSCS